MFGDDPFILTDDRTASFLPATTHGSRRGHWQKGSNGRAAALPAVTGCFAKVEGNGLPGSGLPMHV